MKTISQNPDRYSKQGSNWVISASPDIKPIYLPIGVSLTNLKPVIKANGIIVKVGESYLCSITTLNEIKQSNNPHYDIVENGKIKVKDKEVVIGKTIKIIELNTTKLEELVNSRNFMNLQSGVTTIEYTNDERELVEGVPKKLIDQINYTLDKDSERPKDKFEVVDYFKMVDKKVNPHYTIAPIRTITDQQETIFDPKRLQTFIIELSAQLALLRRDFNTIQATFFDGIIPTPNVYGIIQEDILAQTDTDDLNTNHSNRRTDSSVVIAVEPTPIQTVADDASLANQPPIVPPTNLPTIEQWRLRRKRDGDKNGMGIYPTANTKNFNSSNKADKRTGIIREGEAFSGYKFKTLDNGFVIWAIQNVPTEAPTGYAYQGRGDSVDKV
jgi:hypothetical protein